MTGKRNSDPWLIAAAAFLAAVFFVVDISFPLGVAGGVTYVLPVLLGWWSRTRSTIFVLAALGTLLTLAGYFLSPEGGIEWVVLVNRGLAFFVIWAAALLVAKAKGMELALRDANHHIAERTQALSAANRDLEREIAEHKRATELLRRQALVLEQMSDGVIVTDLKERIVDWNPAAERMFGYSKRDVLGQTPGILHRSEEAQALTAKIIEAMARDGRWAGEIDYLRKDGTEGRCETAVVPLQDERGEVVATIRVNRDLAERNRAQAILRHSEAKLRAILEHAVDGIITIDEHGIVESFNHAAERIFGYEANEVVGRNVKMLMPEPDRARHDGYIDAYLRTGEAKIIGTGREVQGRRKDGTILDLHLGIGEVQHGEHRIFIGTLNDLTERKTLEEQLRQSQKLEALGRLAGGIAHDFNNLLLPIITIAEVTRDDFPPDGREWSNLDKVVKAGQRGRALVDQILKFSRRQPMHRQPIGLAEVVEEALELARALIPSIIQVRTQIDDDVGTVLADPNQIHEVMMNLISNAGQAIGLDTGVIDVSLRRAEVDDARGGPAALQAGTYARLTVSDTGVGMDEATLANIFDPFFTTKPAGEGTGMGLAAVHGIIAQHDGAVTASSEPGEKTTFEIYLPIVD